MQEVTPTIPDFKKQEWLNEELAVKGIYLRSKVVKKEVTTTWNITINCWFPPKIIMASCQSSDDCSDWWSDFSLSFSIRKYNNAWLFSSSESVNLINIWSMVANVEKRLNNWFIINVSSFSGWTKNIYFTCLS